MNIEGTYLGRLLVSLDQIGNTLADGYPDTTISARLWYLEVKRGVRTASWLRRIVDVAFYPVDGLNHCRQAYHLHMRRYRKPFAQDSIRRGSDPGIIAMWILTIIAIIPIMAAVMIIAIWRAFKSTK